MGFPIPLKFTVGQLFGRKEINIVLHGGLTTFVGPNGSGKTQVLRAMLGVSKSHLGNRQVRFLSGGRLSILEQWRSNVDGRARQIPHEQANFGRKAGANRLKSETVHGDFHTLVLKPDVFIKVSERLKVYFNRDLKFKWDMAGHLTVSFVETSNARTTYSCALEASGLLNVVALLTALFDDDVGALFIDEPEASLHHQFQRFILGEIEKIAGDPLDRRKKIVVIATHSPVFLRVSSPRDLPRIVFFTDTLNPPVQVDPDASELHNKGLKIHLARVDASATDVFFARRTLLVEGPSDRMVCSALDRLFGLHLDVSGTQIIEASGKGNMPAMAKLMKLIGKEVLLLADLDMLADGISWVGQLLNDPEANEIAQHKGYDNMAKFGRQVYHSLCETVRKHWEGVAKMAQSHFLSKDDPAERETDEWRRCRSMALILASSDSTIEGWPNAQEWLSLRRKLLSFLESLENAGCYLLRKGAIEDYYHLSKPDRDRKCATATQEVESMIGESSTEIADRYADVLKALKHAATVPPIDELSALRKLLVPVVARILDDLETSTAPIDVSQVAREVLSEKARLFGFSIIQGSKDKAVTLRVKLQSAILDVEGFPIDFPKGCDVPSTIRDNLTRAVATMRLRGRVLYSDYSLLIVGD